MSSILCIIGIGVLVISIIAGFLSGSFIGFLISVGSGIGSSIVLFALAKILENQKNILYKLNCYEHKKVENTKKKLCVKCSREYYENLKSCPYCGYRPK